MYPLIFLRLSLVLLLAVLPLRPVEAAGNEAANAMAEAMERMMEAMGLLEDDGDSPMPGFTPTMPGMGSLGYGQMWPWAQMPWSQVPWGQLPDYGAFSDPIKAFGMPGLANPAAGAGRGWPWAGASGEPLDGIWEGRDGGLLIVLATRFRLQAAKGGHIEGLIRREGERVAMYEPSTGSLRAYELAIHQGRMVLRDSDGNTYLYRRLWLDERWDANPSTH
jgi:hypothetical protein